MALEPLDEDFLADAVDRVDRVRRVFAVDRGKLLGRLALTRGDDGVANAVVQRDDRRRAALSSFSASELAENLSSGVGDESGHACFTLDPPLAELAEDDGLACR